LSAFLEKSSNVGSLLVVRLSAMGDVIHTLPAVQALRRAFPNAMIGWIIEERWVELLCAAGTPLRGPRSAGRPLADWVHIVDLKGWGKSLFNLGTVERIVRAWNDVRSAHYDIAVDLQGAIRSAVLARWSGAPVVWGASQTRETPASLWYTRKTIVRGAHVIEQNLSVVEAMIGERLIVPQAELPRSQASESVIETRLKETGICDFAILNPGAGWGAKRWPAERYGQVARELADCGVQSIINYGPGEEVLAHEVELSSGGSARGLKCSISELIALTRRARLFIGGDTGPLHLAAGLGIPVVGIYGPTDPVRNGPYRTRSVVLRNPASPTSHSRTPEPDEAMLEITVQSVVSAARGLLSGGHLARRGVRSTQTQSEAAHG
jgi:lipopolysaccharide heptosyltransferase I